MSTSGDRLVAVGLRVLSYAEMAVLLKAVALLPEASQETLARDVMLPEAIREKLSGGGWSWTELDDAAPGAAHTEAGLCVP